MATEGASRPIGTRRPMGTRRATLRVSYLVCILGVALLCAQKTLMLRWLMGFGGGGDGLAEGRSKGKGEEDRRGNAGGTARRAKSEPKTKSAGGAKAPRVGNEGEEGTQGKFGLRRNVTVGVVANEFFDPAVGRTGGFGMATKMVGELFGSRRDLGVRVVFVFANPDHAAPAIRTAVRHELLGWPLICMAADPKGGTRNDAIAALGEERIDVILSIDYREDYDKVFSALPHVPIILWARDPRRTWMAARLLGIRHPRFPDKVPPGVKAPKATNARSWWKEREGLDDSTNVVYKDPRRFLMGVVWMPALYKRLREAYNIPPEGNAMPLPNIVKGCRPQDIRKSNTTVVIFVGSLDPYKRPWLLVELAYSFPDVEFWVLGRGHFPDFYDMEREEGRPLPPNVKLLGQETGGAKWERLSAAWFLLSASVHEDMAISYLEALTCETPVLSTVDPGGFVSRFGVYAGDFEGSGMDGLPALREGFDKLLSNHTFREERARLGREHVLRTHNENTFLESFNAILTRLGVETRFSSVTTTLGARYASAFEATATVDKKSSAKRIL